MTDLLTRIIENVLGRLVGPLTFYQIIARRWIYPGEAVLVAVLLAVVPYVAVRGPVTRIVRATISQQRRRA